MALIRTPSSSVTTDGGVRRPLGRWGRRLTALFLVLAAICSTASLPAQLGGRPGNGVEANRPRNLNLRPLSRGRVRLSWLSPRRLNYQKILRADGGGDFRVIENRLPGDLQVYVDPNPGRGPHRYIVEANGDPGLRSEPAAITVGALVVRNLACSQIRGSPRIHLTWTPGDDSRLLIRLDGEPAEGLQNISPNRRQATINVPRPGPEGRNFIVEIVAADEPDGPAARCEVLVESADLRAVRGLGCSRGQGNERSVRLNWEESEEFAVYEIERNGVVLSETESSSWIDEFPPPGIELRYTVTGLTARGHPGPASSCVQEFEPPPGTALTGEVVFDDSTDTALGRGIVLVFAEGGDEALARGGIDDNGRFNIAVENHDGPFDLEYRVRFHEHIRLGLLETFSPKRGGNGPQGRFLRAFAHGISSEEGNLKLRVALPVIAVSPERSGVRRWQALHDHFLETGAGLLIPIATGGGIVQGSLNLVHEIENVRSHFLRQFGSSPRQVDMVAYGFAGLSARLYGHTSPVFETRRLLLLGTPNRGTPRALVETRSDVGARPIRGGIQAPEELGYKAADEQTSRFLDLYNERITSSRATALYLVAGTGGQRELDDVLDCAEHDGRICLQSALGQGLERGIFSNPRRFILGSDHNSLGRDRESLALLERLGLGRILGNDEEEEAGNAGDGGGAGGGGSSMTLGKVGQGELAPGDAREIPFVSDTSGSIIIILNSEDKGPLNFQLRTPGMDTEDEGITGENAAERGFVYESYNDGEGTNVIYFKTGSGEHGTYLGKLDNPDENPDIKYTIEFHLESSIYLSSELDGYDVPLGSAPLLTTELEDSQLLPGEVEVTQSARVFFPDGSLSLVDLNDSGEGGDAQAGDGIYSSTLPESSQPGYYIIEVEASDTEGDSFQRADTLQLLVRSDLASLGEEYESGADELEQEGDGGGAGDRELKDNLWVRGLLDANRGGDLVVLATLTDLDGNTISQAGSLYSLESAASEVGFQIDFDGYEIFGAQADGPYRLTNVEIIDAGVGFIRADLANDVHTTTPYSWSDFSLTGGLLFLRGDTNNDQQIDISDSITLLSHLFTDPDTDLSCRDAGDANADGVVDLSDAVSIVNYLFLGQGGGIPQPYPDCGQNENLGCEYYPYCR